MNTAINISDALFELALKGTLASLRASYPFLNIPIVSQLFELLFRKIVSSFYEVGKKFGIHVGVILKTEHQQKKYDESVKELETKISQGMSDEEIKKARDEFRKRAGALIGLDI